MIFRLLFDRSDILVPDRRSSGKHHGHRERPCSSADPCRSGNALVREFLAVAVEDELEQLHHWHCLMLNWPFLICWRRDPNWSSTVHERTPWNPPMFDRQNTSSWGQRILEKRSSDELARPSKGRSSHPHKRSDVHRVCTSPTLSVANRFYIAQSRWYEDIEIARSRRWSLTWILVWIVSLHNKHFFTRLAQAWHVTICEHGWNNVSRLLSEQTRHSIEWLPDSVDWSLWCVCLYSLEEMPKKQKSKLIKEIVGRASIYIFFWVNIRQRCGSGQRSKGVWFFLFRTDRSAPCITKVQAMTTLGRLS